jgi:hypothetical protein
MTTSKESLSDNNAKEYPKSGDFSVEKTDYVTDANRHAEDSNYLRSNPPLSGPLLNDSATNQKTKP